MKYLPWIKKNVGAIYAFFCMVLLVFCLLPFTIAALKPDGILREFLTDPGFWGNILGAVITLYLIRVTIKEGRLSRQAALNQDIYTTEKYRIEHIKVLITQVAILSDVVFSMPQEIKPESSDRALSLAVALSKFKFRSEIADELQPEFSVDVADKLHQIESGCSTLRYQIASPLAYQRAIERLYNNLTMVAKRLELSKEKCLAIIALHETDHS